MKKFRKLLAISWVERFLLFQAAAVVALSTLGLRIYPWLKVQGLLLNLAGRQTRRSSSNRPSVQQINQAVRSSGRRIPKATCLPQALAAQYLLLRNGYPADLQIGVARNPGGRIEAHAWVVSENQAIVGEVRGWDRFVPLTNNDGRAIELSGKTKKKAKHDVAREARLLTLCARTNVSASDEAKILALLDREIDWELLVRLAYDHQVVPLLYRTLESVAPGKMPVAVKAELKGQIQVYIQGNLSLTQELIHLLRVFASNGIPVIPYKGPVLAASIYHDLSVRSFGDLDILVREEDVLRTIDMLVASGYEIIRPNSLLRTEENARSSWIRHLVYDSPWAYQVVLWNPARQGIIELHWRVTPRYVFSASPKSLWGDLRPVALSGGSFPSLSPENLLWYLCLHATRHKWTELRWVCDVAELLREYPDLDWQQVTTRAARLGVERRLYLSLLLAKNIMEVPLPRHIEEKISSAPQVRALAKEAMDDLFDGQDRKTTLANFRLLTFQLKAMDRMADRFRYFLRFFKSLDSTMASRRKFIRSFSLFSLSSRLNRIRM
ncbi:MAG: lasso peptide biosynthesis B2 protein [Bacteroidota bacterium]